MSKGQLDGMNQEKNVINIFSTFRKEVKTKDKKTEILGRVYNRRLENYLE